MIGKEKITYIRSLHQRKFRQKYHKFIVEGPKIVEECIVQAAEQIEVIYALPAYIQTLENQYPNLKEKLIDVDERSLVKISALDSPASVLAVLQMNESDVSTSPGNMLLLDGVQNPNNMGALLRIADWYGITTVLCSNGTVDSYHPKMIQASMGSFLRVDRVDAKISELKSQYPDHNIIVADMGGVEAAKMSWPNSSILVLGNEGRGPSEEVLSLADHIVSIERRNGRERPESLNVSVAAGIICERWLG